jgi:glucose/mannose-6-phosphate isomerase
MLDDIKKIQDIDKSNMLDSLVDFPNQIKEAVEIAKSLDFETFFKIDNVIIAGMGASGISGDIVASLYKEKIDVPIYVNKDYDLPKWAKKDTLALFYSYSGNTEETISAFKLASQKKCRILCISSGGKLQDFAEKRNIPHIKIPTGYQPRAAIAFSLFTLIIILKRVGLIKHDVESDIEETIDKIKELINNNNKSIPEKNNPSKQIARKLHNTIPQIYGWGIYSPIATRWRQQFNENSKLISREDSLPESNHNDIVGWSLNPEVSKNFSCILFRDKQLESLHMNTRLNFLKKLFEDSTANIIEINPIGKKTLAKIVYILFLGDFISCYLAILRNIDPTPIDIISDLKQNIRKL